MSNYYNEKTVPAVWGAGDDVGFVPHEYMISSQDPTVQIDVSFDGGATIHAQVAPQVSAQQRSQSRARRVGSSFRS